MPIRELTEDETARLLTQQDVDNLPEGTNVAVKWSGGNGPHIYTIAHRNGMTFGCMPTRRPFGDPLLQVGVHCYQVRVFLPSEGTQVQGT